jgi:hypothetical protein
MLGPIFPALSNGTALEVLSEPTHRTPAGVIRSARTSFSTSPAPTEYAESSVNVGLLSPYRR